MKKFCITAFIFLFLFSANAQIKTLNLNDYPAKTAYVKCYSVGVSDVNGKITEGNERKLTKEYFFDKENLTVYEISYNNKEQPYSYLVKKYDRNLLPISSKYTSKNGTSETKYSYSADYKKYEIKNEKGKLEDSGEITTEFGKTAIFDYGYDDEKENIVLTADKTVTNTKINDYREISKLRDAEQYFVYHYDEGKIDTISKCQLAGKTRTETVYNDTLIDKKIRVYTTKYNEKNQIIYYKSPSYSDSNWFYENWYEYTYDEYGSPIERVSFMNNIFYSEEAQYREPVSKLAYEIKYTSSNPIKAPETYCDSYIKDETPPSENKKSDSESENKTDESTTSGKNWEVAYYVDDFKDYTDQAYLRNKNRIRGTFSNSATTNSNLEARFLIDSRDEVSFMLYEYGYSQVKESDTDYWVRIKTEDGKTELLSGKMYSDRVTLDKEGSNKVFDAFCAGGTVKFYVQERNEYSKSTYNFEVDNDGDEFTQLAKNLATPETEDSGR